MVNTKSRSEKDPARRRRIPRSNFTVVFPPKEKTLALRALTNHVAANIGIYTRLPFPADEEGDLAARIRRTKISEVKRVLRRARVRKQEAERALVAIFEGRARELAWSVPVAERKAWASEVYAYLRTFKVSRRN